MYSSSLSCALQLVESSASSSEKEQDAFYEAFESDTFESMRWLNKQYESYEGNFPKEISTYWKKWKERPGHFISPQKPSYVDVLSSKTHIFLWEQGAHSVPETIDTVAELLEAVRKANPNKRILFAAETFRLYGVRNHNTFRTEQLIYFSDEEKPPHLMWASGYDSLGERVHKMGIDMLALDDMTIVETPCGYALKLGDLYIQVPVLSSPISLEDLSGFLSMLSISAFGAYQRNKQWADYIKAVAPYYDIVVVMGENGHYQLKEMLNFPEDETIIDVLIQKMLVDSALQYQTARMQGVAEEEIIEYQKACEKYAQKYPYVTYTQWKKEGITDRLWIIIP